MPDRYVIWSFEHDAWWAPGRRGYTRELEEAGHYAGTEAADIVAEANLVQTNEQVMRLDDALRLGPPMRRR
jgi:hypothetical protein